MDKKSSFQDKVLSRLYGNTKSEAVPLDDKHNEDDNDSGDKHPPITHPTTTKVYTVKQAPSDWIDSAQETKPASSDSSSSCENSSSDADQPTVCKRRKRRGKRLKRDPVRNSGGCDKNMSNKSQELPSTNDNEQVSKTLTKNQKRKLKKKRRNEKLKESVEIDKSKEFVYAGTGTD